MTRRRRPPQRKVPDWLFYVVTLTIVGLWGAAIVVSFLSPSFQMPESLNIALPLVLTAVYTVKARGDSGDNDDE